MSGHWSKYLLSESGENLRVVWALVSWAWARVLAGACITLNVDVAPNLSSNPRGTYYQNHLICKETGSEK